MFLVRFFHGSQLEYSLFTRKLKLGLVQLNFPKDKFVLFYQICCYQGCFGNSYSFSLCIMSHAKLCGHFTRQRIGGAPIMQLLVILILLSAEMILSSVHRYNFFWKWTPKLFLLYSQRRFSFCLIVPSRCNSYFIAYRNASNVCEKALLCGYFNHMNM